MNSFMLYSRKKVISWMETGVELQFGAIKHDPSLLLRKTCSFT